MEEVTVTESEVQSIIDGEHVDIEFSNGSTRTLYHTDGEVPFDSSSACSKNWSDLLVGTKDRLEWHQFEFEFAVTLEDDFPVRPPVRTGTGWLSVARTAATSTDIAKIAEEVVDYITANNMLEEDESDSEDREGFEQYLRENVFTFGEYVYDKNNGLVRVAEMDDGMGLIIREDLSRAVRDENVSLEYISHGWLYLSDTR